MSGAIAPDLNVKRSATAAARSPVIANAAEITQLARTPTSCAIRKSSADARICTFECTFCAACVDGPLAGLCPNCGGNFEPRPIRPARLLAKYPASTERKGPA